MRKIMLFVLIFAALLLLALVESRTKMLHRLADNLVYDNYNHYLPCSALPAEADVETALSSHQDAVDAILSLDPGNIGLEVDTTMCPGKADVVIWYPTHRDRLGIQDILQGTNFYGVPLRLQNR